MPPVRFRLACVGTCHFVGLGSGGTVARAEDYGVTEPTDSMRVNWAQDLRKDHRLEVLHLESQRKPVLFPTTLPCESVEKIEHVNATLEEDQAVSIADFLAQLLAGPSDERLLRAACRDSVERDDITMRSGKGDDARSFSFTPGGGTLLVTDRKRHGAFYRLGTRGDTLITLLQDAFPNDARLMTIVACTDTLSPDSTRGDLPKPGEFEYIEELPEVTSKVQPYYPTDRIKADVEGTVVVQALISKGGEVVKTAVVKSISGLDEHAVRAVEKWRFKPALSNAKPVAVWVAIPIAFHLR